MNCICFPPVILTSHPCALANFIILFTSLDVPILFPIGSFVWGPALLGGRVGIGHFSGRTAKSGKVEFCGKGKFDFCMLQTCRVGNQRLHVTVLPTNLTKPIVVEVVLVRGNASGSDTRDDSLVRRNFRKHREDVGLDVRTIQGLFQTANALQVFVGSLEGGTVNEQHCSVITINGGHY